MIVFDKPPNGHYNYLTICQIYLDILCKLLYQWDFSNFNTCLEKQDMQPKSIEGATIH